MNNDANWFVYLYTRIVDCCKIADLSHYFVNKIYPLLERKNAKYVKIENIDFIHF